MAEGIARQSRFHTAEYHKYKRLRHPFDAMLGAAIRIYYCQSNFSEFIAAETFS